MMSNLRRIAADNRGVAALEFSIMALFMFGLLFGAFEFGNAAQQQIQLQAVVRAGGAYAATYPTDASGIQSAVTAALPSGWSLSSTPSVVCQCQNASTGATSTTVCSTPTCAASDGKLITISATMAYTPLSNLVPANFGSLTSTYVFRYQ